MKGARTRADCSRALAATWSLRHASLSRQARRAHRRPIAEPGQEPELRVGVHLVDTRAVPAGAARRRSCRDRYGKAAARRYRPAASARPASNPIAVDQTFDGLAGGTVTGFARFNDAELKAGDSCGFVDTALVEIDGNPVFEADSCTTGGTGGVVWTYVLTSTGSHTIHGEVQNGVDDILDSSLDMDAPLTAKVPSP